MGLPSYIRNRLNKSDIENQGDLLTELGNLEMLGKRKEEPKIPEILVHVKGNLILLNKKILKPASIVKN